MSTQQQHLVKTGHVKETNDKSSAAVTLKTSIFELLRSKVLIRSLIYTRYRNGDNTTPPCRTLKYTENHLDCFLLTTT